MNREFIRIIFGIRGTLLTFYPFIPLFISLYMIIFKSNHIKGGQSLVRLFTSNFMLFILNLNFPMGHFLNTAKFDCMTCLLFHV